MPTLEESIPTNIVALLIGPAGSGKTTTALQFPAPFLINVDNNLAGPKNFFLRNKLPLTGIRYESVFEKHEKQADGTTKAVPVPIAAQCNRLFDLLKLAVDDPAIKTVILDSTTSLQPIIEAYINSKRGKQPGTKFSFDEWYDFAYFYTDLLGKLRVCGKNVIIIAHEQVEKSDMDSVLRYVLAIPGQMGDKIPMLVTDVWRTSVELKLAGQQQVPVYFIHTVQDARRPNIKTSLNLPSKLEVNQANIKLITDQIYGTTN